MKKKYFVSGDIHGFYTEYLKALNEAGFEKDNENHILIICGDIFDRGNAAKELLSFLCSFPKERLLLVQGNHEDLMENMVLNDRPLERDYYNGTVDTLRQFANDVYPGIGPRGMYFHIKESFNLMKKAGYEKLMYRFKDYYEIGDYIFVHGWIPTITIEEDREDGYFEFQYYDPNWRNATPSKWDEARWKNGMEQYSLGIKEEGKIIVCGHWHASYGNVRKNNPGLEEREYAFLEFNSGDGAFKPFVDEGIIALDACTARTHFVNVVVLEIEESLSN